MNVVSPRNTPAPPPYSLEDSKPTPPPTPPPHDTPPALSHRSTTSTAHRHQSQRASHVPSSRTNSGNSDAENLRRVGSARPAVPSVQTNYRSNTPPNFNNIGGFVAEMVPTGVGSRYTNYETFSPGGTPFRPPAPAPNNARHSGELVTSPTRSQPPLRRTSVENPLELLRKFDTVCIVDDSSSMEGSLWAEARDALAGIADVATRYDADGVDIHFLNSPTIGRHMKNGVEVKRLFDRVYPRGITPLGEKLEELLLQYLERLEAAKDAAAAGDTEALRGVKPVNFIVITDGAPTDDPEPAIIQAAKRLDARLFPLSQVGIQFVQIGQDEDAAEFLRELDDNLSSVHGIRDIVDTVPFSAEGGILTAESITKILLGGINRRVDRRKPTLG